MSLNLTRMETDELQWLMNIVEERQEDTWQWLRQWVPELSRSNSLKHSHIAQILLLGETTMWDLPRWHETKEAFLDWEDKHSSCITQSTAYWQIHKLCVKIENTDELNIDGILLQFRVFGLVDKSVLVVSSLLNTGKSDLLHPKAIRYINQDKSTRRVTFETLEEDAANIAAEREAMERRVSFGEDATIEAEEREAEKRKKGRGKEREGKGGKSSEGGRRK